MNRSRTSRSDRLVLVVVGLVLTVAIVVLARQLAEQNRSAETVLEDRFHDRAVLAGGFVESHLADMGDRQLQYAMAELSDPEVSADRFDAAVLSLGFEAAVLLDAEGRALAAFPPKPLILGEPIAADYDHLTTALAGAPAVSDVTLSAVRRRPIVAVAVPYETPSGRRVISGGYELSRTPLTAFLASLSTLLGEVLLVDGQGEVIASTEVAGIGDIAMRSPGLAALVREGEGRGDVENRGVTYRYTANPIEGSSWRLLALVPRTELFEPVDDGAAAPRLVLASAALLGVIVLWLLHRLLGQRARLDHLSRTDSLTSLANRGEADLLVAQAAAASARTGRPWAVAIIDADNFKLVNDRFGHAVGDRTLRHLAAVLQEHARASDRVARWGGEEFVLVMEDTDTIAAITAAERMAAAVRENVTFDGLFVTVSIGVASGAATLAEILLGDADAALYRAKANGRDRVEVAIPTNVSDVPHATSTTAPTIDRKRPRPR